MAAPGSNLSSGFFTSFTQALTPTLLSEQFPVAAPLPPGVVTTTNPITPVLTVASQLINFPEEVYDLSPESHLMRLLNVILGEAGIGQLNNQQMLQRLSSTLTGSHFFDLDSFYGSLFGVTREVGNDLQIDPEGTATPQQWLEGTAIDSAYKSRVAGFARALGFGATAIGMQMIAEALLSVQCDVYENYKIADRVLLTYNDLRKYTYNQLRSMTYAEMQGYGEINNSSNVGRNVFTITPKREISIDESYDLMRVIDVMKPAGTVVIINSAGADLYSSLPVQGIYADSTFWEVLDYVSTGQFYQYSTDTYTIVPGQKTVPIPRPPFKGGPGKKWSHNKRIVSIETYYMDGNIRITPFMDRVIFYDGKEFLYHAHYASRTAQAEFASSAVGEGTLVVHPKPPRNKNGRIGLGQLYVNGVPIESYAQEHNENDPGDRDEVNHFWASPPSLDYDLKEIMEITLSVDSMVNEIDFEVAKYPHTYTVSYFSKATNQWVVVAEDEIIYSLPSQFVGHPPLTHTHPQHPQSNFQKVSFKVSPTLASRWQIVLKRLDPRVTPGSRVVGPFDKDHIPKPYSLAIRHLNFKFAIRSISDIPNPPAGPPTIIDTVTDHFGNMIEKHYTSYDAMGIKTGANFWRCEPQPSPSSVVDLYVDMRDGYGNAPTVDRWFMDPVDAGPEVKLYYSNDDPNGFFKASDNPLIEGTDISAHGTINSTTSGLQFMSNDVGYVDVSMTAIQFNGAQPWWIGLNITPSFAANDPVAHPIIDLGVGNVTAGQGGVTFQLYGQGSITLPVTWDTGASISIAVFLIDQPNADFTTGVGLFVNCISGGVRVLSTGFTPSVPDTNPLSAIRIGGYLPRYLIKDRGLIQPLLNAMTPTVGLYTSSPPAPYPAPTPGAFTLNELVLKDETATFANVNGFVTFSPGQFTTRPFDPTLDDGNTDNAILRYFPTFVTPTNSLGFLGGPPDFYSGLSWTLIPRTYVVEKGFLETPPIVAKWWKFQFSALVGEPIEVNEQVLSVSNAFPATAIVPPVGSSNTDVSRPGTAINASFATAPTFSDAPIYTSIQPPVTTSKYAATEAAYPNDIGSQVSQTVPTNYTPWTDSNTAMFPTTGPHNYDQVQTIMVNKIGYFVGMKQLIPQRLNYEIDDDTVQYIDHFWDQENISSLGFWTLNPGDLNSGQSTNAVAVSNVFNSLEPISSIQFATQQSDAVQIIGDDDFSDPTLATSTWTGAEGWSAQGDATLTWSGPSSVNFSRNTSVPNGYGAIASTAYPTSPKGRLYATVRFTALTNLTTPVYLQLIAADGVGVLTQIPITATAGQTVEQSVGYTIGQVPPPTRPSSILKRRGLIRPMTDPIAGSGGIFLGMSPATESPSDSSIGVRLVQYGPSTDQISIDALSVFDESIVWEFTVDGANWYQAMDIRNNPSGALSFLEPSTQLQWRVTCYRPNMHINALQIRPAYMTKYTARSNADLQRGPNLSMYDIVPPIENDPMFMVWSNPVPYPWFLAARNFPVLPSTDIPSTPSARGFARFGFESITVITDTSTRQLHLFRTGVEGVNQDFQPSTSGFIHTMVAPIFRYTKLNTGNFNFSDSGSLVKH